MVNRMKATATRAERRRRRHGGSPSGPGRGLPGPELTIHLKSYSEGREEKNDLKEEGKKESGSLFSFQVLSL